MEPVMSVNSSSFSGVKAHIDHLVVGAASLEEGVRWCQRTLGVTPEPGGSHALFGTHNRLLRLKSAGHPLAYLEIIAIDPSASPTRDSHLARWFDLDGPTIRHQLSQQGPQLLHWVASVPNIKAAVADWHALDIDRGVVIEAARPTSQGLLQWKITVRDDGQRLMGGALPTLIEWGADHPARAMGGPALELRSLSLQHPHAEPLQSALAAIGLNDIPVAVGHPGIFAELTLSDGSNFCLFHLEKD
jgi:hypothetical protein